MKRILAPSIDGSFGYRAARTLVNTAMKTDASITLLRLNCAEEISERDQLVMQECRRAGITIDECWYDAEPVDAIVEIAEDGEFDLIVMGVDPHRHIDESLATEVLGMCEVPVLAIPIGDWTLFRTVEQLEGLPEDRVPPNLVLTWHPADAGNRFGLPAVVGLTLVSILAFLLYAVTGSETGSHGLASKLAFVAGIIAFLAAIWFGITIDRDNRHRPRRRMV